MYKRKTRKINKAWFALAVIMILIITGAICVLAAGKKSYRTISVVEVSGSVSVVKDGVEYEAYLGMMLQEGHAVVTSGDSYVRMVLDGDKYVKLESGSRAVFETVGLLGSGKTRIRLERGALTGEVVKPLQDDEEFVINTPNAVLAVRGTFFRVDLGTNEKGEITTDVKTYGGKVAASRVLPSGEKLQEEVLIVAGYKATVNMTDKITYYVGENEAGDKIAVEQPASGKTEEEGYALTTLIIKEEITDEDFVDLYFAAENGHEMFMPKEDIQSVIEERGIELKGCVSVYDVSEEILTSTENGNADKDKMSDAMYVADDSRPLMRKDESVSNSTEQPETTATVVPAPTATAAPSPTATAVPGPTATAPPNPTATTVPSPTATAIPSPTATTAPSPTVTAAPSPTATAVPSPTATTAPSPTVTAAPSPTATVAPTPTATAAPSLTATVAPSPTATVAPTATAAPSPTATVAPSPTATVAPSPTATTAPSPTATVAPSPTATTAPSPTATVAPTPTATTAPSPTATVAPIPTATVAPTPTATAAPSPTATVAPSPTATATPSPTATAAPSPTPDVEVHEHEELVEETEATCITPGRKIVSCKVCGEVLREEEIPAFGHSYGEWQTITEPTCSLAGKVKRICEVCGEEETGTKVALDHDYAAEFTVDTEATCTVAGSKSKHCSRCESTSEVTEIPATGHSYSEWQTITEATCTAEGLKTRRCTTDGCGHEEEESIEAMDHDYATEFTVDTAATCTVVGSKSKHCSRCESTSEVTEIPATGHSYSEWQTITEATCTAEGLKTRICTVDGCGHEEEETIEALDHDYATEFTVDTEATCTVAGSKSKHCSRCESTSEVTEIPATGHSYSEWQTITEATCTAEGLKTRTCTTDGCGYEEEETIEALDHDYATEFTVDTEATCMAVGSKSKHCSRCESTTEVTEIAVLAHNYGEWQTLEEATCTEEGRKRQVCQNSGCGYIDVQTIEALGHFRAGEQSPTICERCNATWIDVNSTVFPDATFRTYVAEQFDTDGNGSLIGDELTAVTSINVSGTDTLDGGCTNLTGISYFANLTTLNCAYNSGLTRLDLDSNTMLSELVLTGCDGLTSLNVTGCTNLLTIDLSDCTGLTHLGAANSGIYNLNIPGGADENASLVNVNLSNTSIMNLYLLYCPDLESVTVDGSALEELSIGDVSAASVKNISAVNCTSLRAINVSGGLSACTSLESVNVTGCSSLGSLEFSNNANLTSLNVDGCTNLAALSINGTNITDIAAMGLSGATSLQYFQAFNANLDDADMAVIQTGLPITLKEFRVGENPDITTLSLYNITELTVVDLMYCTGLTGIDLTGCNPYGSLEVIATGTNLEESNCTGWNGLWTFTK